MTYESRRNILVGLTAFVIAGCGERKDVGVENIQRELLERLNSELKESGLNIKIQQVSVYKTGEHTYKAEMLFIINHNQDKKVTVNLPEGFDLRGKIVPEILWSLGIKQDKQPRIKILRKRIQKPSLI